MEVLCLCIIFIKKKKKELPLEFQPSVKEFCYSHILVDSRDFEKRIPQNQRGSCRRICALVYSNFLHGDFITLCNFVVVSLVNRSSGMLLFL